MPKAIDSNAATTNTNSYLFAYFTGNGEDGLHLASSSDGYKWNVLNDGKSFLKPLVGESKLMRDPCILRGPDGTFHMVWTTAWSGKTIGYASSKDLINWSEQVAVPVMAHEPEVLNCWAPEVVYDEKKREYVIFWASTIRGKFPETLGTAEKENNHRMYFTTTKEFKSFTPTRLFYDPGFVVIDATFLRADKRLYLIVKDETSKPVRKNLRIANAASIEGPFTDIAPPFTRDWVEGPTAIRIGKDYVVYFDCYRDHHYGAVRSRDMNTWEDITALISFPAGARHGTVLAVPEKVVARLRDTH
jgi:beta-xylosidase